MQNLLLLLSRILIAAIFVYSGFNKILSHAGTVEFMVKARIPFASILYYATVLVEFGGGILLILGARARIAALTLAAFLVPVTYYFHFNFADPMQVGHFLTNAAILGGLLQIVAFGAGRISLDRQ